jgi:hypothetical protein
VITETCSCGASIQCPTKLGEKFIRDWRKHHRHEPEPAREQRPEGNNFATIGFTADIRDHELKHDGRWK